MTHTIILIIIIVILILAMTVSKLGMVSPGVRARQLLVSRPGKVR